MGDEGDSCYRIPELHERAVAQLRPSSTSTLQDPPPGVAGQRSELIERWKVRYVKQLSGPVPEI